MQKPLSLKLRTGDRVAAVQPLGSNPIDNLLIVTEMGLFYEFSKWGENAKIVQIWTETEPEIPSNGN